MNRSRKFLRHKTIKRESINTSRGDIAASLKDVSSDDVDFNMIFECSRTVIVSVASEADVQLSSTETSSSSSLRGSTPSLSTIGDTDELDRLQNKEYLPKISN